MASRKFELEIDLESNKAEKDLKKFNKTLDNTNKTTKENKKASEDASKGLEGFMGSAKSTGGALLKLSTAAVGVFTALNAGLLTLADQTRELENFARTAQLSIGEYQALALAAERYGISGEKASEMVQDFNDKLGDFVTSGAGPFNDVLDILGDKSDGFIEKLQTMSGPDGLIYTQNQLQAAGASAKQLTFAMEGVASESSKLTGAFSENGKEIQEVNKQMDELGIKLSKAELAQLKQYKNEWELVSLQFDKIYIKLANKVIPAMTSLGNILGKFLRDEAAEKLDKQLEGIAGGTEARITAMQAMASAAKIELERLREASKTAPAEFPWEDIEESQADLNKLIPAQKHLIELLDQRIALAKELIEIENKYTLKAETDATTVLTLTQKLTAEKRKYWATELTNVETNKQALTVSNEKYAESLEILKMQATAKAEIVKLNIKDKDLVTELTAEYFNLLKAQADLNKEASRIGGFRNKEKSLQRQLDLMMLTTEQAKAQLQLEHEMTDLKLNDAEKDTLRGIQDQIDARQKHLDILAKEKEAVQSLAEAMGRWASGSKDAVKQVIAELIRLVAIRAFGGTGSFGGGFLTGFGSGGMNGYAEGGNFKSGETFMVGEAGPEIITASAPGSVIPNHQLGGGQGISISPQLVINGGVNGVDELSTMFTQFSNEIATQTNQLIKTQLGPRGVFA